MPRLLDLFRLNADAVNQTPARARMNFFDAQLTLGDRILFPPKDPRIRR